jgi:hypothetical protein
MRQDLIDQSHRFELWKYQVRSGPAKILPNCFMRPRLAKPSFFSWLWPLIASSLVRNAPSKPLQHEPSPTRITPAGTGFLPREHASHAVLPLQVRSARVVRIA